MDKRKIFGTIIGLIFWSFCVIFFTYAYYDWRSDPTNIVLGIQDLSVECLVGAEVEVSNMGPVLNYQDGVKVDFAINNAMADNMAIELYLDITSISDNLLTESLKYVLVADLTGGTNYDYNTPVRTGNFSNFSVGNNLITQDLEVTADVTTNYQFIIYIDGNMYNDPNMQENSLTANLMIGNCDENAVSMNELVYQAIYSETDNSLTFVHTKPLTVGETYNDKVITAVYTGFETANYVNATTVPWYSVRENVEKVNFDSIVKPKSTAYWFYKFSNIEELDLSKLDTSNTISMGYMFNGCSSLTELDLNNFDISKVTNMNSMFYNCNSLISLNLDGWNTSKVTNMNAMFYSCYDLVNISLSHFDTSNVTDLSSLFCNCYSITNLDLRNFNLSKIDDLGTMFYRCEKLSNLNIDGWDTSSVIYMDCLFEGCSNLESLDLSIWNTSNVVDMSGMFNGCSSLLELDLSTWNVSSVTNMSRMFQNCSSLIELDLSSWDVSKVTTMYSMFSGNTALEELDISGFNLNSLTDASKMFRDCKKLMTLDMRSANFSSITSYSDMFLNFPVNSNIVVKDNTQKTWLNSKFTTLNNINIAI